MVYTKPCYLFISLHYQINTKYTVFFYFRDLADVSNLAKHNDGVKFLLVCIDAFSRYLWVVPLMSKNNKQIMLGLKLIFEKGRVPEKLRSDKGKEFTGRETERYLKKEAGVEHFVSSSDSKACFAERVIRTLKNLMYRYFQRNQTYRYLEVLQSLVQNYNRRPHSSLPDNLSPSAITSKNEALIWKRMYVDTATAAGKRKFKFQVGDLVRLTHLKHVFQRDFQEKWTQEIFIVTSRNIREGVPVYTVQDWAKEPVEGAWYESELQKVRKDKDVLWKVEKILRRRTRQGQKEVLIKWIGWPDKFISWEPETSLQEL